MKSRASERDGTAALPLAGRLVNGCSVSKSPPFGCQRANVPEIPMRLKGKAGSHYTSRRRNRSEVKSSDLHSWPGTRSTRAGTTSSRNLLPYPAKLVSVVKTHGNATEFQSSAILDCPPRRIVVDFRCLASHGKSDVSAGWDVHHRTAAETQVVLYQS